MSLRDDLNAILDGADARAQELQATAAVQATTISQQETQLAEQANALVDAEQARGLLQATVDSQAAALREQEATREALSADLVKAQADLAAALANYPDVTALTAERDQARADLAASAAKVTSLTASLATVTADRDARLVRIAELGQIRDDLLAKVASREQTIRDLRAQIATLTGGTTTPSTPTAPSEPLAQPAGTTSVATLSGATLSAKNASLGTATSVFLPEGTYSDRDFRRPANSPTFGHFLHMFSGMYGAGRTKTKITLDPGSLNFTNTTDAEKRLRPRIEAIVEPNTIPYYLMRVDRASVLQDLTIEGTPQGIDPLTGVEYSYHGLMFYGTQDPTLRRVVIRHIPGSKGVPPNETFPLYFYRVKGIVTMEDLFLDGDGVASSGVSGQPEPGVPLGVRMNRVKIVGGPNGAGWTSFNREFSLGIRIVDLDTDGSLVGANFENVVVSGGNAAGNLKQGEGIRIVRPRHVNPSGYRSTEPTWKRAYHHLALDASTLGGTNGKSVPGVSNRVDVYDPVLAAGERYKVCISDGYGYQDVPKGGQAQRGSDVHVWTGGRWEGDPLTDEARYVGGVERPDLIEFTRSTGAGLPST